MKATRNRFKGLKANKKMTILQQSNETKKFFVCARYLEPQGTLRPPSQGEHATSSPRLEKIEKRNPLQEFWLDLARGLRRESKPSQGLEVANQPRRTGSFVMARAQWNGTLSLINMLSKRFTWWHPAHGTGHIIDHFFTNGNCFPGRSGGRGAPAGNVHWDDFYRSPSGGSALSLLADARSNYFTTGEWGG